MARLFERALLGAVMNAIAFIVERRVLKAIRATGGNPPQPGREGECGPAGNGPAGQA